MIENDALAHRANEVRRALAKLCTINQLPGELKTVEKGPILIAAEQSSKFFKELAHNQLAEANDAVDSYRKGQDSSLALQKQVEEAERERRILEEELQREKAAKRESEEEKRLLKEHEDLKSEIADLDSQITARQATQSKRRDESTESIMRQNELYKRLGLSVSKPQSGVIKIGMAYIDPANHDKEFYFTLAVNPRTDKFEVFEICPPIPKQEKIIADLVQYEDLSVFARKLRAKWKENL